MAGPGGRGDRLSVARVRQGLFGSAMIPEGMALLKIVFPSEHLRGALMPIGPIMGLAAVAGPILAGWLLHLDPFGSGWRSIFLINVPFGVLAAGLGWRVLPRRGGEDRGARLDLVGVGLLALWWSTAHWGDAVTGWRLAPALFVTGAGAGLLFILLFDFVLGDATPEEVGTGAGVLNAAQQSAGAIGVAALGTVFFARVDARSPTSHLAAAELVFAGCAGLYALALLLVGLLPKHAGVTP